MKDELEKLLELLENCRKGHCYKCPYMNEQCTDNLIDYCYNFLSLMIQQEQ